MYAKQIIAPKGVNTDREAHLIDSREWTRLEQFRPRRGVLENYPGWTSIFAPGTKLTGLGALIYQFNMDNGAQHLILGDSSKLYRYIPSTKSISNLIGSSNVSPSRTDQWWPITYNNTMYLTQKVNGLYKWIGVGPIVPVAGAPAGKSIQVYRDHLCMLNVREGTTHYYTMFKWAAEGLDNNWTPSLSSDAGSFEMKDSPDHGVALYPFGEDLLAYMGRRIIPITYIGGNEVFGRRDTIKNVGLLGPFALADVDSQFHLFMGHDAFYSYTGGATVNREIGLKINKSVYPFLHPELKHLARAIAIDETDEIIFCYPDFDATFGCNKAVVYSREEQEWYGPFPISVDYLANISSNITITIDEVEDLVADVDDIIDLFGASPEHELNLFIQSDGDLMELNNGQSANGTPITRVAETGDLFLGIDAIDLNTGKDARFMPGTVFQTERVRIEMLNIADEVLHVEIGSRMELNEPIKWTPTYRIRSHVSHDLDLPVRVTGRWFRMRFTAPNSARIKYVGAQFVFAPVGVR